MNADSCARSDLINAYGFGLVDPDEGHAARLHLAGCVRCRDESAELDLLIDRFVSWPTDILRPRPALAARLSARVGGDWEKGSYLPGKTIWCEPEWEDVAPGIACKLLASDSERRRVSMLVRLAPGASYPPHTHAGVEDLHLLDGELWIDGRKLRPGDYNRGPKGTSDAQVWSETGCTCVLVTSTEDILCQS